MRVNFATSQDLSFWCRLREVGHHLDRVVAA
jgi:hypothetical protein